MWYVVYLVHYFRLRDSQRLHKEEVEYHQNVGDAMTGTHYTIIMPDMRTRQKNSTKKKQMRRTINMYFGHTRGTTTAHTQFKMSGHRPPRIINVFLFGRVYSGKSSFGST